MNMPVIDELLTLDRAKIQHIAREQSLFSLGDPCNHYVIVKSGTVRVELLAENGQQLLLYRIEAGQSCVMTTSCLLGRTDYFAQAISETDVEMIFLPQSVFQHQLNESAEFRDFVFDGFAERLGALLGRTAELTTSTVDQRLAAALLSNAQTDSTGVSLNLTHNQLAMEIGTSREVVSRRLAVFEKNRLIEKNRGYIKLINSDTLSRMCTIL